VVATNVPVGHFVHVALLVASAYMPAAQRVHAVAPAALNSPMAQPVHDAAPVAEEYLPAAQAMQEVEEVADETAR